MPDVAPALGQVDRLELGAEGVVQLGDELIEAEAPAACNVYRIAVRQSHVHGQDVRVHGFIDVREVVLLIVSTRVGDVDEMFESCPGQWLAIASTERIARSLDQALVWGRTSGRDHITERFALPVIARRVYDLYELMA